MRPQLVRTGAAFRYSKQVLVAILIYLFVDIAQDDFESLLSEYVTSKEQPPKRKASTASHHARSKPKAKKVKPKSGKRTETK